MKKYTGQKNLQGLSQKIINQIPAHSIYQELFAGSGIICELLDLKNIEVILNDIDPEVKTYLQNKYPKAYVRTECANNGCCIGVQLMAKKRLFFLIRHTITAPGQTLKTYTVLK